MMIEPGRIALYVFVGICVTTYLLWWSPRKRAALTDHWRAGFGLFNWGTSAIACLVMVGVWPLHLLSVGLLLWRESEHRVVRDAIPRFRSWWAAVPKLTRFAWLMGAGMIIFTVHNANQPGLDFVFIPWVGFIIMAVATWRYYEYAKKEGIKLDFGPKRLWIPLAIISGSIVVSGALELSLRGVAIAATGVLLFVMYVVARHAGRAALAPFKWAIVALLVVLLSNAFVNPGIRTGGFYGGVVNETIGNYAMAIRLLMFGGLTMIGTNQWKWVAVIGAGVFATGGEEGVFIAVLLGLAALARRDISRKMLLPLGTVVGLVVILWPLGVPQSLYSPISGRVAAVSRSLAGESDGALGALNGVGSMTDLDTASGGRASVYRAALERIRPVGNGYYLTDFGMPGDSTERDNVHNVPLMIMDQVGPAAALAWLWVCGFMLVKSRWRYMFIGILAMSVLDHALWTQAAPWWWVAVGVASTSLLGSDRMFDRRTIKSPPGPRPANYLAIKAAVAKNPPKRGL